MKLLVLKMANGFDVVEEANFSNKLVRGLETIEEVGQYVRMEGGALGAVKSDDLLGRYREAWIPDTNQTKKA